MRTTALTLLISFAPVLISAPARASKKEGVTMADQANVAGKTLVLNGMGVREATVFNVNVYVAGLYLEQKSSDPSAILGSAGAKQLVMHFVRDVERADLVDAFDSGFEKTAGRAAKALAPRVAQLNGWMTDMKVGDRMVLTEVPGAGIEVTIRGKKVGTIPGADFARAFWAIFIGPEPPNAGLKSGLLGR